MYDLEESNWEKSWNLPSEMVALVSTCMIWSNQIATICMKIVEICRVKRLLLYQHIWFGGIKLPPFVWNSWNMSSEIFVYVSTCMIWRNQNFIICMKIVEIYRSICMIWRNQIVWNISFVSKNCNLHVWFGGIKLRK